MKPEGTFLPAELPIITAVLAFRARIILIVSEPGKYFFRCVNVMQLMHRKYDIGFRMLLVALVS